MNERIKQLAEQAGPTTIGEINTNLGSVHVINIEKFAELIIKECWTAISPFIEDDNLAEDALAEIKEHFGVEE